MISRIKRSFSARITLWIVTFAAVIMVVFLLLMSHFTNIVLTDEGASRRLMITSLVTVVVSIIILGVLCWLIVRHYLHPLDLLASAAQRIADGKIDENVPNTGQRDEIGQLQNSFAKMQQSLAGYISELNGKREELSAQNLELERAYQQTRDADGVKAQFLGRMTTQMGQKVEDIDKLTNLLSDHHAEMSKPDMIKLKGQMLTHSEAVTDLLDQMLDFRKPLSNAPRASLGKINLPSSQASL